MEIRDLAWPDFPDVTEAYLALYDEVEEDPDLGVTLLATRPSAGEEAEGFGALYRKVLDGHAVAVVAVVAVEEGRPVGVCTVTRRGPAAEIAHIGVVGLMVARPFRRRGFGRALLTAAVARCRGRFELLELSVFASNPNAQALYRELGFRSWGTLPKAVRRGDRYTDLEHMVLVLPQPDPAP